MPSVLHPCPECGRHVRIVETSCPFCSSSLPVVERSVATMTQGARPLSRAALVFAGAALVTSTAGCGKKDVAVEDKSSSSSSSSGGMATTVYGPAPIPPDAGVIAVPEAIIDAAAAPPTRDAGKGK